MNPKQKNLTMDLEVQGQLDILARFLGRSESAIVSDLVKKAYADIPENVRVLLVGDGYARRNPGRPAARESYQPKPGG